MMRVGILIACRVRLTTKTPCYSGLGLRLGLRSGLGLGLRFGLGLGLAVHVGLV